MRKRKNKSGFLWVVTIILIAVLVAVLWYLEQSHPKQISEKRIVPNKTSANKQPQFEFYTILPRNTSSPSSTQQPISSTASLPILTHISTPIAQSPHQNPAIQYVLQLADVEKFTQADALKANFILDGYSVQTQKIMRNGKLIYHLTLGPYFSLSTAQAAQKALQHHGVKTILVQLPLKNKKIAPK